jgi:predicted  nucleic acid-binding Zn-ribbon protein
MEQLTALEKKVAQLLARIKEIKTENSKLLQKVEQLSQKLENAKSVAQANVKAFDEERDLTKTCIDNLIRSIDTLINEQQQ